MFISIQVAEAFKPMINSTTANATTSYIEFKVRLSFNLCTDSPFNDGFLQSLQYSLAITSIVEILAAAFFFLTAAYIVRDKLKVDRTIAGEYESVFLLMGVD